MKIVIQRVSKAHILIDHTTKRSMGAGYVVLLGIGLQDDMTDVDWLVGKLIRLRVFGDDEGKMNKDVSDISGSILVVSQFTLYASTKKGNRPSFIHAAKPDVAIPLYEAFIQRIKAENIPVITGEFGADMQVSLVNDGPVTIIIDSKHRV